MATNAELPSELLMEAAELARDATILPDGIDGLARKLLQARNEGRPLRVKLGVDPTSAKLHLGHARVFRLLRRFQERGHTVVFLKGGFTAQIGDPTGRNQTRPSLSADEVDSNTRSFLAQLRRIIDVDAVEVANNTTWFDAMQVPEFFGILSKVTVNQLLAKEDFATRMKANAPLAVHEFMYPLLQGFDSVRVRADVELGGTDQRFNLLMGRQLQPLFGQEPQVAIMVPILNGTCGKRKMSKTFGNSIGLDDSADEIVAKVMSMPDAPILEFFGGATNLSAEEVERERLFLAGGGNPKQAKERLARRIALELTDEKTADAALAAWQKVHSQGQLPDNIPEKILTAPVGLVNLLVENGIAESKTKARRLIVDRAVKIDGVPMTDVEHEVALAVGTSLVLRVGPKKFLKLVSN